MYNSTVKAYGFPLLCRPPPTFNLPRRCDGSRIIVAEQPSLRNYKLDVNYKECHNSIVGVLFLCQNAITSFNNSILVQAQINVM